MNCWNINLAWKAVTDLSDWGMDTSKLLLLKTTKGFLECFNPNQTTERVWTLFSELYFNENLASLFFKTENYIMFNTLCPKGKFFVCLLECSMYLCNIFIMSLINSWLLLFFSLTPFCHVAVLRRCVYVHSCQYIR